MRNIGETLIKGRDWTKQLQSLMKNTSGDDVAVLEQKELVDKIFGSLTEAISLMSDEYSDEVFQIPASSGDRRSEDSVQSRKRLAVKERRGGYKRRKYSESWTKISSSMGDEYTWRKYGQKGILNATFPRCYFRCTHKHDQGCKATKQVQRIQEEPIKFQITYISHHTCKRALIQPNYGNIILDSYSQDSNLIGFQSNTPSEQYLSPSCQNLIKEENKELEVQSNLTLGELPSLDYISLPDLQLMTRSNIEEDFLPGVYSYASSIDSLGMDLEFFSKRDDLETILSQVTKNV